MSPIRSPTLVSGVASFSPYRSLRCRHPTGSSSPSSACSRRHRPQTGAAGWSLISHPSTTGLHSSSSSTRVRISRVLPWPRSPSSTRSCPASRARSSAGSTLSSKPTIPGNRVCPERSRSTRFARISALTVRGCAAAGSAARKAPRVVGRVMLRRYDGCTPFPRSTPLGLGPPVDLGEDDRMALCGDGLAVDSDLAAAAEEATRQAVEPLGGQPPDLQLTFVCGVAPDAVVGALERSAEVSGAATVLGCSAGGVIGAGRGVEMVSAVSVWAAVLPDVRVRSFHLEVMRASESLAVVGMPVQHADDEVAVLLADPYSFPVDAFVEQANDALPGLPLVGGLASGVGGAGSTRLIVDGVVHDRGAVGVVLS